MKVLLFLSVPVGLALLATPAMSQDKKGAKTDEPGPVHEKLAKLAGEYTTVAAFRIKPDQPPMESPGAAKITSVMGGRFILEENSGTTFGDKFTGLRLIGFNNATGQYEASWSYSRSTAIMLMTGTSKDDGKTIDWSGSFATGKDDKMVLHVTTRIVSNDRFEVELIAKMPDGSKGPTLLTTYTR